VVATNYPTIKNYTIYLYTIKCRFVTIMFQQSTERHKMCIWNKKKL